MGKKNNNTKGIEEITKTIKELENFVQSLNGKQINLGKEKTFIQGPYLHQDSENSTEEESAKYERDNKQVFDYLQSLNLQINNIFKKM